MGKDRGEEVDRFDEERKIMMIVIYLDVFILDVSASQVAKKTIYFLEMPLPSHTKFTNSCYERYLKIKTYKIEFRETASHLVKKI